jgi:hypothetical protein
MVTIGVGLALAFEANGPRAWRTAAPAVAAGLALAAVQLLAGWSMYRQTGRPDGVTATDAAQWALHPARLLELLAPGFFAGRPGPTPAAVFLWFDRGSVYPLPFLQSVFVGLPVMLCAGWGWRSSRAARWCAGAAAVLLWLALGHRALATQALAWVPVWGAFRYAEKLVGPVTLLLAVMAGLGLPAAAERGVDGMRRWAPGAAALLLAASAAVVAAGHTRSAPASWPEGIWTPLADRLGAGLALAGGTLAMVSVAAARHPRPAGQAARERSVAAAVLLTGLLASPAALHAGRPDSRVPAPLAVLHRFTPVPRVIQPVDRIALPVSRGFDMFDAAQLVRSSVARPSYNVPARIDSLVTYTGLLPRRYGALLDRFDRLGPSRWAAFRRLAVTHVATTPPLTAEDAAEASAAIAGGTEVVRDRVNGVSVYAVPHTPWARFASAVRRAADEREALDLMVAAAARGDAAVVLEGDAPASLAAGSVLAVDRGTDRLRIVAEAPAAGLLVVADSWWPGWEARIDGRQAAILRADAIFRAVKWPPGRHVLEMRYRPGEVRAGALVSAATALLLCGLAAVSAAGARTTRAR